MLIVQNFTENPNLQTFLRFEIFYFGVVVKVEHTAKACNIKIMYATMSLHSVNITLKETQILNRKPETVTKTKTKASLLCYYCKSNAVAGTNEERGHYLSNKTKYPKNFIEWLDRDTEERACKAQEPKSRKIPRQL